MCEKGKVEISTLHSSYVVRGKAHGTEMKSPGGALEGLVASSYHFSEWMSLGRTETDGIQCQTLKNSHTPRQEEEETLRDTEENHGNKEARSHVSQQPQGRWSGVGGRARVCQIAPEATRWEKFGNRTEAAVATPWGEERWPGNGSSMCIQSPQSRKTRWVKSGSGCLAEDARQDMRVN